MLNIKKFVCNMIQENCYVVSDETGECVIIDCGAYYPEERRAIVDYIDGNRLVPQHLLATHGHIDHNFGNNTIFDHYKLQPEVHYADRKLIEQLPLQAEVIAGVQLDYDMPPVGTYLNDGDTIGFGTHQLDIIETPGHTPGGVFYYCKAEKVAFTGDTLFRGSIGRTDFEGGSMFQMIQSLRMVSQLPDDTTLMPGHGEATTLSRELANNPYMDR